MIRGQRVSGDSCGGGVSTSYRNYSTFSSCCARSPRYCAAPEHSSPPWRDLSMAQTRTITRKQLAILGMLGVASRALHGVYRPPPPREGARRSFLVVEPWGIGDVVLS